MLKSTRSGSNSEYVETFDPNAPQVGIPASVGAPFAPTNFSVSMAGAFETHEGSLRFNPGFDDYGSAELPATPNTNYELIIDLGALSVESSVAIQVKDASNNVLVSVEFHHNSALAPNSVIISHSSTQVWQGSTSETVPTQVVPFTNPAGNNTLNLGVGSGDSGPWAWDVLRIDEV